MLSTLDGILPTTRAMVYQPVVLDRLRGFGILDQIEKVAYLNSQGIYWRDIDGHQLAHLPLPEGEHVLLFGQYRMANFLLEEISKYPSVEVRFSTAYAGCIQHENKNFVEVMLHETSIDKDDDITYTTNWLIGADGANSSVRRSLCIPFEGFSFTEFTTIGADVCYDFAKEEYDGAVMNFVVHPEDWAVVVYTGQQQDLKAPGEAPPLWRVAYMEPSHLPMDSKSILERATERCGRYAKGRKDLQVTRAEPYRLHQRCAAQAIKGRVLLAGDALHSNNPIGGLGLTTGICDAWTIGSALARVCTGEADEKLVAEAANERLDTWRNVTNELSMANLWRISSTKPEHVKQREGFFDALKNDPSMPMKVRAAVEKIAGRDFATSASHSEGTSRL